MTFLVPCNSQIIKSRISRFVVLSWPPHLYILLKRFAGLRPETSSYLIYDGSEDKKEKDTKMCVRKIKIIFEEYKNYLEAAPIENKHLEKNKIDVNIHKEFIKKNKLILKTQQRFRSENYKFFIEKINKFALSSNDDIREYNQLIQQKHMYME